MELQTYSAETMDKKVRSEVPAKFDSPVEFDIRISGHSWKNRYSVANNDSGKVYRHELVLQGHANTDDITPVDRNNNPLPMEDCDTQIYIYASPAGERSLGSIRYNPPLPDSPQFIALALHGMPSLSDFLAKHIVSGRLEGLQFHLTTAPNDAIDLDTGGGKLQRVWRVEERGELSILTIDVSST